MKTELKRTKIQRTRLAVEEKGAYPIWSGVMSIDMKTELNRGKNVND